MHLPVTVSFLEVGFVRILIHEGWIREDFEPLQSGPQYHYLHNFTLPGCKATGGALEGRMDRQTHGTVDNQR
jgi:hypothetical protein